MTDPSDRDLQKAFDQAAEGLDLRLTPAESAPIRCVGIAFVCIPFVTYDVIDPEPVDKSDDRQIRALIRELESLSHKEFRIRWREFLHDPHVAITSEGLVLVDQKVIDKWFRSKKFKTYLEEYPPLSPRGLKVHRIRITYNGFRQATATYRVEEEHAGGQHTVGNQTVILVKLKDVGWRIIVLTKDGRHVTPL